MAFEKIDRPYEFLVRWSAGKISGAHVGFETGFADESGATSEFVPSKVQPVDIGTGNGFPLDKILDQLHIDAIAAMDEARAAQTAAEQATEQANARTEAAEQSLAAFVSIIESQLAALKETNAKK